MADKVEKKFVSAPWGRFIFMSVFILLVAIGAMVEWPMGPMNLTWGGWLIGYGGYVVMWIHVALYLIATERGAD